MESAGIEGDFTACDTETSRPSLPTATNTKSPAIIPGRMELSIRRATDILLARRDDVPPDLTAAVESWKPTLDALEAPAAGQPALE